LRCGTHLSNVDVIASLVNLRVVEVENGRVEVVCGVDVIAGVVVLDDVSVCAVLSSVAEAD
jgi:hypothetical protein